MIVIPYMRMIDSIVFYYKQLYSKIAIILSNSYEK